MRPDQRVRNKQIGARLRATDAAQRRRLANAPAAPHTPAEQAEHEEQDGSADESDDDLADDRVIRNIDGDVEDVGEDGPEDGAEDAHHDVGQEAHAVAGRNLARQEAGHEADEQPDEDRLYGEVDDDRCEHDLATIALRTTFVRSHQKAWSQLTAFCIRPVRRVRIWTCSQRRSTRLVALARRQISRVSSARVEMLLCHIPAGVGAAGLEPATSWSQTRSVPLDLTGASRYPVGGGAGSTGGGGGGESGGQGPGGCRDGPGGNGRVGGQRRCGDTQGPLVVLHRLSAVGVVRTSPKRTRLAVIGQRNATRWTGGCGGLPARSDRGGVEQVRQVLMIQERHVMSFRQSPGLRLEDGIGNDHRVAAAIRDGTFKGLCYGGLVNSVVPPLDLDGGSTTASSGHEVGSSIVVLRQLDVVVAELEQGNSD